jgi:CheY-like chemotaxis protein
VKNVLVVDDEPVIREVVADVLRDEGYAVASVGDGKMALDYLGRETPDLILMDVMMPGMDGRQAYVAMRSRPDLPNVPVVMMSAAIDLARLDPSIAGYLPKPFDLDDLVDLVERLIGPACRK